MLAFKEINAAGGILGRKIEVLPLDIQTKPEVARAAVRKAADMDAYALMGPGGEWPHAGPYGFGFYYPLPAAVLLLPIAPLPVEVARIATGYQDHPRR